DIGPVLVRDGIFNPPDELILRRRKFGLGIGFLQAPAIDPAHEHRIWRRRPEILRGTEEVADTIVGEARFVAWFRHLAETVVDHECYAAGIHHTVVTKRV